MRYARRFDVDPQLVAAVITHESSGNPRAVSRAGAKGLMQLMPSTAAGLGVKDPFDPEENIRAGTWYLKTLLNRFGDVRLALAAYNAGPNAVRKYKGVPPYDETRRYVQKIMGDKARLGPPTIPLEYFSTQPPKKLYATTVPILSVLRDLYEEPEHAELWSYDKHGEFWYYPYQQASGAWMLLYAPNFLDIWIPTETSTILFPLAGLDMTDPSEPFTPYPRTFADSFITALRYAGIGYPPIYFDR